jgi:diguanylate cyclase (GGDEF)-like protein
VADVDGLKRVNDRFGHEAGDQLIRSAAHVFRSVAPPGALVARLGGDEFGMLICGDPADRDRLVDEIRAASSRTRQLHGSPLSMSLGAASCPPMDNAERAWSCADERALVDKSDKRVGRTA